jgi:hypothetical protein
MKRRPAPYLGPGAAGGEQLCETGGVNQAGTIGRQRCGDRFGHGALKKQGDRGCRHAGHCGREGMGATAIPAGKRAVVGPRCAAIIGFVRLGACRRAHGVGTGFIGTINVCLVLGRRCADHIIVLQRCVRDAVMFMRTGKQFRRQEHVATQQNRQAQRGQKKQRGGTNISRHPMHSQ